MFFRSKKSGPRTYLQVVENHWRDGRPQQSVLATVGRLDELQASGQVDALLSSGARFAQKLLILAEHQKNNLPVIRTRRWGTPLVFEKLWRESSCQACSPMQHSQEDSAFDGERELTPAQQFVWWRPAAIGPVSAGRTTTSCPCPLPSAAGDYRRRLQ